MVMCWAPGCKHYNQRETCRFYKFPKDVKSRNQWKKHVRRDIEPGPGAFLCSCHFREGKRENGPELFLHNESKRFTFTSPEKKKKRSKKVRAVSSTVTDVPSTSTSTADLYWIPKSGLEEPKTVSEDDDYRENVGNTCEPQSVSAKDATPQEVSKKSTIEIEVEHYFLQQQLERLEKQVGSSSFSIEQCAGNDSLINMYTGLPNFQVFEALYNLLKDLPIDYYLKWSVEKISRKNQLFLCLMKLKQNFPHLDLAQRFQLSPAMVTNIVTTWVHVLYETIFKQLMKTVPSRNKNKSCLPNCFSTFTNCRIILDCTEMATVTSRQSMNTQKATYSNYKHRNTYKALIGVAPNGVITFASKLYPGSTSDKKIVQQSGVLNVLKAGDLILADKGFLIRDILPPGVNVNIPPFLVTPQFSPEQVYQTQSIAKARIHVERAIRRIKCFKILTLLPYSLLLHADEVFQSIVALTNFQNPLIKEVEEQYSDASE